MKMEALPLHLWHSQHFSLPAVYCWRFLFLVFTIFMSCLAPSSRACPKVFECGDHFFEYPFGPKNSGCGDPALQLDCDHEVGMPLINISGYQYYVVRPSYYRKEDPLDHMRIVDKNMWGYPCNLTTSNHTMELWSSPQFRISDEYMNLSVWGECGEEYLTTKANASVLVCNKSWYYSNSSSDLSLGTYCKSLVHLPVRKFHTTNRRPAWSELIGFRVNWHFSKGCEHCESRKELCIYDTKNQTQLSCESLNPGANTLDHAGGSNTAKRTAIAIGVAFGSGVLLVTGVLLVLQNWKMWFSIFSKEVDLSNVEKFLQDYVHQMPCRFSYSQLMEITSNFAQKVGEGGFGVVYKGKLPTGDLVAVKMLDQSKHSENQFMNEVATIGRIHHAHLVRLMGYCYEEYRNALVYEYMANGSLDKFIFAERKKEQYLNWVQLYSIALGAARGMAYLHQDCDNRIIHFDIKPHNILLDEEFTPKVADFGLAKLCRKKDDHISMTVARGTPGYVAPEVWNRNLGPVTDKSDVYSFGMVLLEMVGGRQNFDVQVSNSSQLYFPEWAFKLMETGQLERGLRGGKAEIECEEEEKAIRLAKVGLWCIQYNSTDRPSMSRVVQMLEGNGVDVTNPPLPFDSSICAAPSILSIHSSEGSSVSNQ